MKEIQLLNRYSFLALIVLLLLPPPLHRLLPATFANYFDAFDKLSIPLWLALYSYFWIIFHERIKKLNKQIPIIQGRVSSYEKLGNKEYTKELIEDEKRLSVARYELSEAALHLDFINVTLRGTAIMAAIIKIIQFIIL